MRKKLVKKKGLYKPPKQVEKKLSKDQKHTIETVILTIVRVAIFGGPG